MEGSRDKLVVFYDGSCPACIKDRRWYEKLSGRTGDSVEWLDITCLLYTSPSPRD